jgi:hypothetical protein
MKRLAVLLLLALPLLAAPASAFDYKGFKVNPNDQAMVSLLWMVMTDLQMCGASLNNRVMDTVSAVGHLNNAQSALKKTDLDPGYVPLVREILDRIGKIKFYLVMQDYRAVQMRLQQLMAVIRTVLVGETQGMVNTGNQNYYPMGGGYAPNSSGFAPMIPSEIPIGGGQQIAPQGVPSHLVPVR